MELLMIFLTLLVIGLLCLLFKSTRLVGVVGLTLLFLVFPIAFFVLLIVSGLFLYICRKLKRRNLNVYSQPKLPD